MLWLQESLATVCSFWGSRMGSGVVAFWRPGVLAFYFRWRCSLTRYLQAKYRSLTPSCLCRSATSTAFRPLVPPSPQGPSNLKEIMKGLRKEP